MTSPFRSTEHWPWLVTGVGSDSERLTPTETEALRAILEATPGLGTIATQSLACAPSAGSA